MDTETWIKQVLSNDEDSSDAELVELFVANGVSESDSLAWVARRQEALTSVYGLL